MSRKKEERASSFEEEKQRTININIMNIISN